MWRNNAICVDHWARKAHLVRDPSVFACGMGQITGAHFDVVVLDDVVVYDNSSTQKERG